MKGMLVPLTGLAGGVGLFVFGMQMCSEGLQKMATRRLKMLTKCLTCYPVLGLGIGALVTLALQSSSATSALVVGFISAGLITLAQALGVLLGSSVGASLTAQIIVFRTAALAPLLLFTGSGLYLFSKRLKRRNFGQAVLGFGLIFYGMSVMSTSMEPLQQNTFVTQMLIGLQDYPVLEFVVGTLITAIFQSSTAFMALLMTLATHQLIDVYSIIPFVLGAHLGGTLTGVLSSMGTPGLDSKRAAFANFGFKLINGLVFLPFYRPLTDLIRSSSADISREIANAHTLFSVVMALGFLPLVKWVAYAMERLVPEKHSTLGDASLLQEDLLKVPELAVDQAHRQTVEMGRILQEKMMQLVLPVLNLAHEETIETIKESEKAMDTLYKKISCYLAGLGNNRLPDDLMQRTIKILYTANDLEHIGDLVVSMTQIATKIEQEEVRFSEEGFAELTNMYQQIQKNFLLALQAFQMDDTELARQVIQEHPRILRLEKEFRYNHFDRMQSGNSRTMATSSAHLDLIESILRINGHSVNIAQGVLGIV
ncbi:MAG TPA: Na/Pi cotransporter family protein [Bacillota bacterium]|nr:Na/Pi cotransporter family protein [Bacillota bacterium]